MRTCNLSCQTKLCTLKLNDFFESNVINKRCLGDFTGDTSWYNIFIADTPSNSLRCSFVPIILPTHRVV